MNLEDYTPEQLRLEVRSLRAENKRMVNIEKAARDLFNWHMHVEGGIVPNEAWAPLEEAIYRPVDDFLTESTKNTARIDTYEDCVRQAQAPEAE